jgi:hypothetical protein
MVSFLGSPDLGGDFLQKCRDFGTWGRYTLHLFRQIGLEVLSR